MTTRSTRPATIADLAASLKLSKSAVSNALNNRPGVSPATRARVQAAAERSGWRPNALAKALSTGQAGAFGLCIARDSRVLGSESYYQRVIAGIEEVLIDSDHALLLRLVGPTGRDLDVYRQWAREHRVDAVALFDLQADDPRPPLMDELGLPAVIQGSTTSTHHPVVNGDVHAEVRMIIEHVRSRGASRVIFLHGPTHFTHEIDRLAAMRAATRAHGMPLRTIETDYSQEQGLAQGRDLLADGWADAVITSNDLLAVGVARALGDLTGADSALQDPADVRIVSWDDSLLCAYMRPGITALNRHPQSTGRQVGRLLLSLVGAGSGAAATGAGSVPEDEGHRTTLVVRESSEVPDRIED
ncbi:LacI family DNA-binding transcriptional regulator [Aestuariimicrobium sp. T2.26MG-19.2B]|uniref:LacI family DNA-binding transcriptional regulator n=1 Tax=Aestuariimicrobium sp. T2.26MG-19.2B TaxID=3040679 RepID=UPI002477824D|nr:LacI family DNA-binding transcriptional regulator [Aestuariimicrobium sp. T2.26MG-19.2B]CAI9406393.1 HTH-type transcriptional repressor PurR [Aestuariimicrobium sp. T2.26MG-19.2B]